MHNVSVVRYVTCIVTAPQQLLLLLWENSWIVSYSTVSTIDSHLSS